MLFCVNKYEYDHWPPNTKQRYWHFNAIKQNESWGKKWPGEYSDKYKTEKVSK